MYLKLVDRELHAWHICHKKDFADFDKTRVSFFMLLPVFQKISTMNCMTLYFTQQQVAFELFPKIELTTFFILNFHNN